MNRTILKNALVNAAATTAYIMLVATFMSHAENLFGHQEAGDTVLAPIIFLLLFVISAAITGFAVFGRPVMWYMEDKKREAVALLGATIGFLILFVFFFISIAIL